MKSEFQPISQFLPALFPTSGEMPVPQAQQAALRESWRKIAGKVVLHSQPLLFTTGRLVIFVESAVWGSEVRHRREHLRTALKKDGVAVSSIEVKILPVPPKAANAPPKPQTG